MRILISLLFLYPSRVGGTEHYILNLLSGFRKLGLNRNITVIVNDSIEENYINNTVLKDFKLLKKKIFLNRAAYDLFLNLHFDLNNYDLLFSPNYITPLRVSIPTVTVIHDLQYKHFPKFFPRKKRMWLYFAHRVSLSKATRIVAISNFVKQDLLKYYGRKYDNKVSVIYNPIDISRLSIDKIKYDFEKKYGKYILSVAAQYPHKNLLTLVKAYNSLPKEIQREYKLILVGQFGKNLVGNYSSYYRELKRNIQLNKNIILTGYVSDSVLGCLYKNCKLFVFPSLFEGFGMPTIESMMFGKPTIVSDIPAMREITKGIALYVDEPENPISWRSAILKVLKDYEFYKSHFVSSISYIKKIYSPESIAENYLSLFKEVMDAT